MQKKEDATSAFYTPITQSRSVDHLTSLNVMYIKTYTKSTNKAFRRLRIKIFAPFP